MQTDKTILVTLTSRLFADELSALQARVGSILPLRDFYKNQNLNSVGLALVCPTNAPPDYVAACTYLSKCTLAVLEEVSPDTLTFTRIDHTDNYPLKNVSKPYFGWSAHSQLALIPPIFGMKAATVHLESNGHDIVFPQLVPLDIAQSALQKLLLFNIYYKLYQNDPLVYNLDEIRHLTTNISYMGQNYVLDVQEQNPQGALAMLDNLSLYLSIMSALLPSCTINLVTTMMRHDQHNLLDVFRGVIPREVLALGGQGLNLGDDLVKMEAFITYLQALSSVFNLGPRFHIADYSSDTLTATGWLAAS